MKQQETETVLFCAWCGRRFERGYKGHCSRDCWFEHRNTTGDRDLVDEREER